MMHMGDIAFSHPRKMGFYSKAVRYLTKSNWSHCFIGIADFYDAPAVLESDLKCQVVDFYSEYVTKNKDVYEIWRPIKASQELIRISTKQCYLNYAGETYGFLQIPWFAVRSILKWLKINHLSKNWFPDGIICSELVIEYLLFLDPEYYEAFKGLTPNETSPEDIYQIVINRPDLFEKTQSTV